MFFFCLNYWSVINYKRMWCAVDDVECFFHWRSPLYFNSLELLAKLLNFVSFELSNVELGRTKIQIFVFTVFILRHALYFKILAGLYDVCLNILKTVLAGTYCWLIVLNFSTWTFFRIFLLLCSGFQGNLYS